MEQSAEEVLAGLLQISVGDVVKPMPTLKAKYVPAWGNLLVASEAVTKPLSEWTVQDAGTFGVKSAERMLDLVAAYDRTAALGGREWLAENADPQQLHAALVQMVGNAFPLANAPTLVDLAITQAAALSVPPNDTSGSSTTGASTRKRSGSGSTRAS